VTATEADVLVPRFGEPAFERLFGRALVRRHISGFDDQLSYDDPPREDHLACSDAQTCQGAVRCRIRSKSLSVVRRFRTVISG
jgi:hypothetical protein